MGVISLVFGVLCIVHAIGLVAFAMKLIGVALIYDGISDLWIVIQRAKAMKNKEAENAALEVEYQEVVDEEQGEEQEQKYNQLSALKIRCEAEKKWLSAKYADSHFCFLCNMIKQKFFLRRLILQKPELIQDRTVFRYFFLIR